MNDELNTDQDNTVPQSSDLPATPCAVCQKDPCMCPSKAEDAPQKDAEPKPRIKGTHREGKPPETKWI